MTWKRIVKKYTCDIDDLDDDYTPDSDSEYESNTSEV